MLVTRGEPNIGQVGDDWDWVATALMGCGALLLLLLLIPVVVFDPIMGLAAAAAVIVFAMVVAAPVRAAYLFFALTPLLAGFERGSVLPVLRPSEALLGLLLVAVAARFMADGLAGRLPAYERNKLDNVILLMAVFSSIVPMVWRVARGFRPQMDDILFATTLWKYFLVFALFRLVVKTPAQVRTCLVTIMATGAIVAIVAILQSLALAGAPQLIARVYGESLDAIDNNRGSSTLGTSHGVADVMAFDLAIAVAFLMKGVGRRTINVAFAALFGLACFASGQFSALFAMLVVVFALGVLGGRLIKTLAYAIPGTAVSLLLLQPVLQARLASTNESGVPSSWDARRYNLENYFWSELFRSGNWILGVRPAGRLPSYEPWREWVYIESGHTWLLWTGGIPFFLLFFWFCWIVARPAHALAQAPGLPGALGISVAVAFWVIFVLMIFDVHLTMRGPADAFFPYLALLVVAGSWAGGERISELLRLPAGRST